MEDFFGWFKIGKGNLKKELPQKRDSGVPLGPPPCWLWHYLLIFWSVKALIPERELKTIILSIYKCEKSTYLTKKYSDFKLFRPPRARVFFFGRLPWRSTFSNKMIVDPLPWPKPMSIWGAFNRHQVRPVREVKWGQLICIVPRYIQQLRTCDTWSE